MATQFEANIRNLMVGRGILPVFTTSNTGAITLFSGDQPSANTLISDWNTIRSLLLITWQSVGYAQSGATSPGTGIFVGNSLPSATAQASGTATWGVIWATNLNVTPASSLPTTSFIIVPVSDSAGNGVIKLASTSLVSGSPYTIQTLTINIT